MNFNTKYLNKNINTKLSDEEENDNEDMFKHSMYLPYYESARKLTHISFTLDEQIREPRYYRQVLHRIKNLEEHDTVEISIDSYGGYLDGAIAIINAIDSTEAQVVVKHEGMAASAASLIVLAAPSVYVSPNATMMIHSASFGSFGKQTDVLGHAAFVDQKVKMLMSKIYKDFLTDSEFAEVLMGREMWMHYDEIIERLERRAEIQEQRHQEVLDEINAEEQAKAQQETKVKPKTTKTKASPKSEAS